VSLVALMSMAPSALADRGGTRPPAWQGCGDTAYANVTLTRDYNCTGDGIIVGAAKITIDLNAHTLAGDGDAADTGILNSGFDDVTISGGRYFGSVRNFGVGIRVRGGADGLGVLGVMFDGVDVIGNGTGMAVRAFEPKFNATRVFANTGNGIELKTPPSVGRAQMSQSRVFRNGGSGIVADGGLATDGSDRYEVEVSDNGGDGINVTGWLTMEDDHVTGNGGNGVVSTGGAGLVDVHVNGNGLSGADLADPNNGIVSVTGSEALSNGGDGIRTGSTGTGGIIALTGNRASSNGDDGIDIDYASARPRLKQNEANFNFDLGIEAVAGVRGDGTNWATGNGNPLQCTNVFCRNRVDAF
jgi:hypothetical protein